MIAFALAISFQAAAVQPSQIPAYTRVDTISQYVMAAAACPRFGYEVVPEFADRLSERVVSESEALGVDKATVDGWAGEIMDRQVVLFGRDMERSLEELESGGDPARIVSGLFDRHEALCAKAAADPVTVGLLTRPTDDVIADRRRVASDALLEGYGKASWQTARIFATGELLAATGVCKSQISAERHDALLASHLPDPAETDSASKWLAAQYVEGLQSAPELDLDATQCARILRTRTAAVR